MSKLDTGDKVGIALSFSTQTKNGAWIRVETNNTTTIHPDEKVKEARERSYTEAKRSLDDIVARLVKEVEED